MRRQLDKLVKGKSTKAERKFAEILKARHIPFFTKVKICGREVDFLIGRYAIDIDGHPQDTEKNILLHNNGWIPVHYNNDEIIQTLNIDYLFN